MANSVNDFKAKLVGGGARPNLFRCEVPFPAGTGGSQETATFLIKAAQIPAAQQGTIEVPYRGRKFKIPGDRTFDTWTIKVINDTTFDLRNAFENWLDFMNPAPGNSGKTAYSQYMAQLRVYQLDKGGNDVKCYTFVDAYPATIGAIELGYDQNDAIEEFDVTFNYQYWLSSSTIFTGKDGGAGIGGLISGLKSGLVNAAAGAASGAISRATGGLL